MQKLDVGVSHAELVPFFLVAVKTPVLLPAEVIPVAGEAHCAPDRYVVLQP